MATTSAEAARSLLDGLGRAGIEYAVLHGEERLSGDGPLSDVDVITRRAAGEVLSSLTRVVNPHKHTLVMHWEYDDGAVSSFWLDQSGRQGVQLDILHDPAGRGRYGFKTDVALDSAGEGTRFPKLRSDHELLYLGVKRFRKGDWDVLAKIRPLLGGAIESGYEVLSDRGSRQLGDAFIGRPVASSRRYMERAKEIASLRAVRRVVHPIGVVALISPISVEDLGWVAEVLDRVLINVTVMDSNSVRGRARAIESRFRPHVLLERRPILRPSLTVKPSKDADVMAQLIQAMGRLESDRLQRLR